MPHTVPTSQTSFAIDMYATYADSFDLSFLKSDSGGSELTVSQATSTTTGKKRTTVTVAEVASQLSPCYIPTTVFPDGPQSVAAVKKSPAWTTMEDALFAKANLYTCPLPSPPQDTVSSSASMMSPPAYSAGVGTAWMREIKQEHLILPPSPPESDGAFESDVDMVKNESDTEPCIDIEYFLKNSFDSSSSSKKKPQQDHHVLRECLQDTTFQKKHNLKPIALESLFGGWNLRGDIEPVISLALEQAKCDIRATCSELDISPGKLC